MQVTVEARKPPKEIEVHIVIKATEEQLNCLLIDSIAHPNYKVTEELGNKLRKALKDPL